MSACVREFRSIILPIGTIVITSSIHKTRKKLFTIITPFKINVVNQLNEVVNKLDEVVNKLNEVVNKLNEVVNEVVLLGTFW